MNVGRQGQASNAGTGSPKAVPAMGSLLSVAVVGLGNIGSAAANLLARIAGIGHITLIDKDRFEQKNIFGQDIEPREVGRWKAQAVARRLRRIRPDLQVRAIVGEVESIPITQLRANVVAGCLDSRAARRYVSGAAWHLCVPYVDAGVEPDGLLARVSVYPSNGDAPCYVCGWTREDYEAEEAVYSCSDGSRDVPPTDAPASLGSLAASLQVIEIQKLLGYTQGESIRGCELLVDAACGHQSITRLWRDTDCAFDHLRWNLEQVSPAVSVGTLVARSESRLQRNPKEPLGLFSPTRRFARKMTCGQCGYTHEGWRVVSPAVLRGGTYRCPQCVGAMIAVGHDMKERLDPAELSMGVLRERLGSLGFRSGDVVAVGDSEQATHFEIAPGKRHNASVLEEKWND